MLYHLLSSQETARHAPPALLVAALLLAGCQNNPGNVPPPDPGGGDFAAETARGVITVANGGTLQTPSGVTLTVAPLSLGFDTEVTLHSLGPSALAALNGDFLFGVEVEPHELQFIVLVTLRVPLPAEAIGVGLSEVGFRGSDPANGFETGDGVELDDTGTVAIFRTNHFSGFVGAVNCHKGVYSQVTNVWTAGECDLASIAKRVTAKYPAHTVPLQCGGALDGTGVEALLETYFDVLATYDKGVPVPRAILDQCVTLAEQGRQVVFAFHPADAPRGSAPPHFFPESGGQVFAHTAPLVQNGSAWEIRNTLKSTPSLLRFLGSTTDEAVAWWPLIAANGESESAEARANDTSFPATDDGSRQYRARQDLNTLRQAIQNVLVEANTCGLPGCAGSDSLEVNDPNYAQLAKQFPFRALNARDPGRPWAALVIYVERSRNNPCQRLAGCWRFEVPQEGGTPQVHILEFNVDGQIKTDWLEAEPSPDNQVPAKSWYQFVNILPPSTRLFQTPLLNVRQQVTMDSDWTGFSADYSFQARSTDSEGHPVTTGETFRILNAKFSQNQPEEQFTATWRTEELTVSVAGENSNSSETPILATRVDCPELGDPNVYDQSLFAELDIGVCGPGILPFSGPLLALGLMGRRRGTRRRG